MRASSISLLLLSLSLIALLLNALQLGVRFWVGHCFSVFFHYISGKLSILIHICLPIDRPTVKFLLWLIINYKGCRNNKCCHGLHRKGSSKKRRKLAEMFLCLQVTSTPQICTPPSPCNSSADSIGSTAKHTRLRKEDNTSCLKDAFQGILLVIVYNETFYDSIPHLKDL